MVFRSSFKFIGFEGAGISLEDLIVQSNNLPNAADFEFLSVLIGEGLAERADLGVVVTRHSREQVMLKLVLHATEEILSDKIVAANSTCGCELI